MNPHYAMRLAGELYDTYATEADRLLGKSSPSWIALSHLEQLAWVKVAELVDDKCEESRSEFGDFG